MHTQGARLQDPNGCFLITPRAINPGINLVEESFDPDMETDECTAWMRWDVGAVETDLATSDRKYRIVSTQSICDASNASPTSAYSIQNEFVYKDVPFEFDETIEASQFPTTTQMLQDLQRPTQGCSVLTAIEQQRLEAIAMPFLIVPQTNIEPESPITLSYTVSPSPSPSPDIKPTTSKLRKWKSLVEDNEAPNTLCQSRKRDHNAIEKRYRTNLNDKISCLREGIPPLWRRSGRETSRDEGEDSDNENGERKIYWKYGKAAIISRALEYIQYLEDTAQKLGVEVEGFKMRAGAFEKLAMSGSLIMKAPELPQILVPRQSLLSIQDDFKQRKTKSKSASSTARKSRIVNAGR